MNRSPWRLEEVDGGDEQYPVESCFAVRATTVFRVINFQKRPSCSSAPGLLLADEAPT